MVGYPSLIGEPPWLFDFSSFGATSSSVQEVNAMVEKEARRRIAINFFIVLNFNSF